MQFHSELPPTSIWSYRPENVPHGEWNFALGPTFKTNVCQDLHKGLVVQHINDLPPEADGFGHPETTVHLHGGHHPSRSDGFPGNIDGQPDFLFGPGEHYNYCYPMLDPGFIDNEADPSERPSTLWYPTMLKISLQLTSIKRYQNQVKRYQNQVKGYTDTSKAKLFNAVINISRYTKEFTLSYPQILWISLCTKAE